MKGLIGEDHVDTIGRQNHGTIASSDWPDIAMLISSRFPDFRVVECSRIERIDSAPWAYNLGQQCTAVAISRYEIGNNIASFRS